MQGNSRDLFSELERKILVLVKVIRFGSRARPARAAAAAARTAAMPSPWPTGPAAKPAATATVTFPLAANDLHWLGGPRQQPPDSESEPEPGFC